jgi:uncharacterized OsmC-like protein
MSSVRSFSPAFHATAAVLSAAILLCQPARAAESPLRAHLQAKAAAIEVQKASATQPQVIHATVTAESRSGVRRLRLGDDGKFQYISDSGRGFAGYNLGAGSWDSLVGTLASAVADEYLVQAAVRKVPLDSLDIVFTSIPERKSESLSYPNNLSYVAYIDSPASDAELEALKKAVHENSSAINLVTKAQNVSHATVEYKHTSIVRDRNQPPGLRDFIVEEKIPAVQGRRQQPREASAPAQPAQPRGLVAHTHVEPQTGLRQTFLGEDGYHLQLHDSAPGLLGYGLAPTVEEHLLGVTGTCLTHIFEVQAATRNVLLDSLELTVDGELTPRFGKGVTAPARFKNIRYNVRIESPESEQTIDALRQAVEATCPLYNLVKDEQKLEGKIVHSAYKKEAN